MILYKPLEQTIKNLEDISNNPDEEKFKAESESFYKLLGEMESKMNIMGFIGDYTATERHYQKQYDQIKLMYMTNLRETK